VELFHKLLDLSTLLSTVALGVVHRAPRIALVTARGLSQTLVILWATTRTNHNSSGSTSQRLVLATDLLFLFLFVAALSSGICIGLASLLCLWGRL
jgi:hypothetical protein